MIPMGIIAAGISKGIVAPSVLWTPSEISTALWLDADDAATITEVSSAVSQWNDKSGNSRHVAQSEASRRPTYPSAILNSLSVVRFDGIDDLLIRDAGFFSLGAVSCFVVGRYLRVPTYSEVLVSARNSNGGGATSKRFYVFQSNTPAHTVVAGTTSVTTAAAFGGADWIIKNGSVVGTTQSLDINGVNEITAAQVATDTPDVMALGALASDPEFMTAGSNWGNVDIAEVIFVADNINKERIEGYLAHKWGLTASLPGDHPYKTVPPYQPILWTPEYTDTALWLDADDASTFTLVSDAVSEWRDKSGNTRHATQATPAARPTIAVASQNGLDTVNFNGSTQYLDISGGLPISTDMTVVEVFHRASTGIISMVTGGTALGPPYTTQCTASNLLFSSLGSSGYGSHDDLVDVGVFISSIWRSFTTTAMLINGVLAGAEQAAPTLTTASLIYVGRRNVNYHDGRVLEFIAIAANVGLDTRQQIEGYLAHKWGLTASLAGDHPYKTDPPYVLYRLTEDDFVRITEAGDSRILE